jgi:hypothetical protein
MSTTANPQAWARFEAMLRAMQAGELITLDEAVAKTGIVVESAELVLDALVRADLLERHGHQFKRMSLLGDAELQAALGSHRRYRHG